jgi:hypothetical protein
MKTSSLFIIFLLILILIYILYNKGNYIQNIIKKVLAMLKEGVINIRNESPPKKIVVFDLDETLGCFIEISMFWNALEEYYGIKLANERFYNLLNIFPEFLRPNIINILHYLKDKKINNECDQIMIYTNNQGPKSWVYMISNYFNQTVDYELFDKIIAAFKVNGKIVELNRTSHGKSVKDLIRCTKIQTDTEICFIDDQYHPLMNHENVYYINLKPYVFSMPYQEMAERYFEKEKKNIPEKKEIFVKKIVDYMNKYNFNINPKSNEEKEVEKVITKQIMIHLEDFFKKKKSHNTKKRKNTTTTTTTTKANSTKKKYMS